MTVNSNITDIIKDKTIAALKEVYDPEIPVNVYDLGFIYNIEVNMDCKKIIITMTLTSPLCPAADLIINEIEKKVKTKTNLQVDVNLTFNPPWDKSRMSKAAKLTLNMF